MPQTQNHKNSDDDIPYSISFGDFASEQKKRTSIHQRFLMRNRDLAKITGTNIFLLEEIQATTGAVFTFSANTFHRRHRLTVIKLEGTAQQVTDARTLVQTEVRRGEPEVVMYHPPTFMPCDISVVVMQLDFTPLPTGIRSFEQSTDTWVNFTTDSNCLTIYGPPLVADKCKSSLYILGSSNMEHGLRNQLDPDWVDLFGPPSHYEPKHGFVNHILRMLHEAVVILASVYFALLLKKTNKHPSLVKAAFAISAIDYLFLRVAFFLKNGTIKKLFVLCGLILTVLTVMLSITFILFPKAYVYISIGIALLAGFCFAQQEFWMVIKVVNRISTRWKVNRVG